MKRRDWLARTSRIAVAMAAARTATLRGASFPTMQPSARCLGSGRLRWLVGWSPGGGYDAYSRVLEPFLEEALGVEVFIDNVPGAAGRVAALTLARARADGRTLGILDGAGLLWAAAMQERNALDLAGDLTILARLSGRHVVLAAGPRTRVASLPELLALARTRRIAVASTAPGSVNFVSSAVVMDILGIDADFVVGFPGSREVALAVLRGDVDATVLDSETLAGMFGRGRLAPLLSLGREHTPFVQLDHVPRLTGDSGVAGKVSNRAGPELANARDLATALDAFLDVGRLVGAPAKLPAALETCLRRSVWAALSEPRFHAAVVRAGRSLDIVPGDKVAAGIPAARAGMQRVFPIAAAAARRAR